MDCPSCGSAIREEAKFCGNCGHKLGRPCPDCGHENPPEANFCEACGAAIGAQTTDRTGEPGARVELRQVTILFADLTGYTRLTRSLGPERTHALVRRFFEVVDGLVRDYGGNVERHIGDEVMAVFGAPVAHSNDPERALRTAQAIHDAMAGLSESFGLALSVHAGIATGPIVVSGLDGHHTDSATVGDVVNLAARLVALADPGATVVSDAVYQAVPDLIVAESVGEVSVKGIDRPVAAFAGQRSRLRYRRSESSWRRSATSSP